MLVMMIYTDYYTPLRDNYKWSRFLAKAEGMCNPVVDYFANYCLADIAGRTLCVLGHTLCVLATHIITIVNFHNYIRKLMIIYYW